MKRNIIITLLCLSPHIVCAGTNTASFLNVGAGARPMGMGGAFTAVADDAYAAYWNPAGLGKLSRIQVGTMVQTIGSVDHPTLKDVAPRYQFVDVVLPLKKMTIPVQGTAAVSFINNTVEHIPYTSLSPEGHVVRREVSDTENGLLVSYGLNVLAKGLSVGGGLRYVRQSIDAIPDGSANGFGMEGGVHYTLDEQFSFGFVTQTGVMMKWSNGHRDSGSLRNKAGVAYRPFKKEGVTLITAADVIQVKKYPLEGHFGAELRKDRQNLTTVGFTMLALRAGLDGLALDDRYRMQGRSNENLNWTFGMGLGIAVMNTGISLDYATGSTALGSRHRISCSLCF